MYCITLRNKFDKTIIGWYDASASNFSTDQRRASSSSIGSTLMRWLISSGAPRLAQDIEVTSAVQPTALLYSYSSNGVTGLLLSDRRPPDDLPRSYRLRPPR